MGLGEILGGAAGTLLGQPALGAALGGALIGGASSPSASSNQVVAKPIEKFTGVGGSATESGFQWAPDPLTASNVAASRSQLGTMLGNGMTYDPAQAGQYQDAFLNARMPALQQQQPQQAQQMAANTGATGMAGSSGALYQDALRQQFANQQTSQLQNEAIAGGQNLAMQDLQQKLASAGFLQGVGQQDFQNSLNAQQGAVNSRINAQSGNINMANQANQAGLMNAQQQNQNQQNLLRNVFGGAGAGMDLYKGITGSMNGGGSPVSNAAGTGSVVAGSSGVFTPQTNYFSGFQK
jgi:hypothetical protein